LKCLIGFAARALGQTEVRKNERTRRQRVCLLR